ncbi:MAG: hypothetical protein ACI8P0_000531 [Planctomycetaceae bacterium]|jgi:hypothetical protein
MNQRTTLSTILLAAFTAFPLMAQDADTPKPADAPKTSEPATAEKTEDAADEARLAAEAAFSELLSGATLVGNFTTDSDQPVDPSQLLRPDRYELATVNKIKDDFWLFVYVHKGVPIPLSMKVLWAGKTPVLTLDEFTIAGMGTFSARLMFHGDRYAGTWQHGKVGGLMFGKIETAKFKKERLANPKRKVTLPRQSEPKPNE